MTPLGKKTAHQPQDLEMEDGTSIPDHVDVFVKIVLGRRGNLPYLVLKDRSRSWQHRDHLSDDLIEPLEASWEGYHLGVDVLYKKPAGHQRLAVGESMFVVV